MEQEKPFKTIEVIDSNTKQLCKIACMSCIRGHRTTSCGIPVCRTKIFWTVKRPGRPSNSCTCRFGSSGVCKCVTAIPKCPHKSKKGEKRSAECRCDEQGRFCCLLEPLHWESLFKLERPLVQFYTSRDALEMMQSMHRSVPGTPSAASTTFPSDNPPVSTYCGSGSHETSSLHTSRTSRSIAPSLKESSTSPYARPRFGRFGFMGVGGPMGPGTAPPDVMAWNNDVPVVSFEDRLIVPKADEEDEPGSCCGCTKESEYTSATALSYTSTAEQYNQTFPAFSSPPPTDPSVFDFDRWSHDYQIYQFPNAICQNCGLNGCTCRSCPPLMQNFGTTSWAQSCGRRHARIAPMPPRTQESAQFTPDTQVTSKLEDSDQSLLHLSQEPFLPGAEDFVSMPDIDMGLNDHDTSHLHDLSYGTNADILINGFHDPNGLISPQLAEPLGFIHPMPHRTDPPGQAADVDMFAG